MSFRQAIFNGSISSAYAKAATVWIGLGACTGGLYSGGKKFDQIYWEPSPTYAYPGIEGPIHYVYNASRVAAHAGWGAAVGGSAAATAPISMPAYYWYTQQKEAAESNIKK